MTGQHECDRMVDQIVASQHLLLELGTPATGPVAQGRIDFGTASGHGSGVAGRASRSWRRRLSETKHQHSSQFHSAKAINESETFVWTVGLETVSLLSFFRVIYKTLYTVCHGDSEPVST